MSREERSLGKGGCRDAGEPVGYGDGMCTLLLGRDLLGPGTLVLATNRDEDPERTSSRPTRLAARTPIACGRDLRAGGTWLAVRGGQDPAAAALLNRRPEPDAPAPARSRGELPLALVTAPDPRVIAHSLLQSTAYGPCTLLWLSPETCWALTLAPGRRQLQHIGPGWHVITHADLDDPSEPRTEWLLRQLAGFAPNSFEAAESRLTALLVSHGEGDGPPVCIHEGRMPTVSASSLRMSRGSVHYEHAEGPPCTHAFESCDALLAESVSNEEETP